MEAAGLKASAAVDVEVDVTESAHRAARVDDIDEVGAGRVDPAPPVAFFGRIER